MLPSAVIGQTSFIGGHLKRVCRVECGYDARNIDDIIGQSFDTVYCVGMPITDRGQELDAAALSRLEFYLGKFRTRRLVLISTTEVYPTPLRVDESTPIDLHSVGYFARHRLQLEQIVLTRFSESVVLRMPSCFGRGLNAGVLYDLLRGHVDWRVHPDAVGQFYNIEHLRADIQRAFLARLRLLNLVTEPISLREAALKGFGRHFDHIPNGPPPRRDVRTIHSASFGRIDAYLASQAEVLRDLRAFVSLERSRLSKAA